MSRVCESFAPLPPFAPRKLHSEDSHRAEIKEWDLPGTTFRKRSLSRRITADHVPLESPTSHAGDGYSNLDEMVVSVMLEVLYRSPRDSKREANIESMLAAFGGNLTYREEPVKPEDNQTVCLTYEFSQRQSAELAASKLREVGEHVQGPMDYGED